MAVTYFGLNRGDSGNVYKVVVGTSANANDAKDLELHIDLTKNLTRLDVELLVQTIMNYINGGDQNTNLPL